MQLDIICIICLNKGAFRHLFNSESLKNNEKLSYFDMLKFCFDKPIEITDKFPKQICDICVSNLTTSYEFKRLCESSFEKINDYLTNYQFQDEYLDDVNNILKSDLDDHFDECKDEMPTGENVVVKENVVRLHRKKKLKKKKKEEKKTVKIATLPYFCELCQKSFRNEKLHKERVHTERNPSQCERCAAVFLKPYSLSLHMRQHDNNLPYPCTHPGCGKAFAIPSMLKQHAMSHTDERPFVCQYCSHAARTKQQLIIHIRYHHTKEKNYKCSFCEKAFVSYQARYNHEKRHKNIRDHRCQSCEKTFLSAGNLVNHMLTHTGEKKFECRLCGSRFGRKAHRNKHETNVHGVAPAQEAVSSYNIAKEDNSQIQQEHNFKTKIYS